MNKIMSFAHKCLFAIAVALTSAMSFAEGEVTHILPQTDAANGIDAFTTLAADLTAWSGKFMPIILGILGVFLVYWLIKFGLRLFKSFAGGAR